MKQHFRVSSLRCFVVLSFFVLSLCVKSSADGHYRPGVVGIRDGTVTPKGVYLFAYAPWYSADKLRVSKGIKAPLEVDVQVIVPQLLWSSGEKVLGGDYAMALIPTFSRQRINDDEDWGFGDLGIAPLVLGWRGQSYELTFGDILSVPTGQFDQDELNNFGLGYWSNALGLRSHFYSDQNRTYVGMLQLIFETNGIRQDDHFRAGNNLVSEWGISRSIGSGFEIGLAGYDYWQITDDKSPKGPPSPGRERVHAAGAQLAYWVEFQKLLLSIRWLKEYEALYRTEGTLTTFNVSYQF